MAHTKNINAERGFHNENTGPVKNWNNTKYRREKSAHPLQIGPETGRKVKENIQNVTKCHFLLTSTIES